MSEATGTTRDAVVSYLKDRAAVDAAKLVGCAGMFRTYAEMAEAEGQASLAKHYREAAHRCQEGAAWLNDERQAAGPQDVEATPPMTIERACEVLTAQLFMGRKWLCTAATAYGDGISPGVTPLMCPGYMAIAVAEKILRDAPAKEVARA